jgi:ubiquinone/menaquinone biosynthesis C-methylase UbiE
MENKGFSEIKKENVRVFDDASVNYDKRGKIEFTIKESKKILTNYEKSLGISFPDVDKIFVLGCGTGNLLLHYALLGKAKEYYGIDISPGMIDICRKNAQALNKEIFVKVADAEDLPFEDGSFDAVVGHAILHHIPDVDRALREVYRIMKPGGFCIFSEPTMKGSRIILSFVYVIWFIPLFFRELLRVLKRKKIVSVELHTFSPADIEKRMKIIGFCGTYFNSFAGFSSRIVYWILNPLTRIFKDRSIQYFINAITGVLNVADEKIFSRFIPKDRFDEFVIFAVKK